MHSIGDCWSVDYLCVRKPLCLWEVIAVWGFFVFFKQLIVSRTYQFWCFFLLVGSIRHLGYICSRGAKRHLKVALSSCAFGWSSCGVLNVENKVSCHVSLLSLKCSMVYTLTLTVFTSPWSLNFPYAQPVGGLLRCQRSDLPFTSAIVP